MTDTPDHETGTQDADDERPTILQVIPEMGAGGAEQTTIDVARAIIAAGGRALVATRGGFRVKELEALGAEVRLMPVHTKNPAGVWVNSRRLSGLVKREGVHLIHARSRAPAWSALWAARRARVPFVTTYHGTYKARSGLKRFYNSGMIRGEAIIANSGFIAQHIATEHGIAAARIDVIPRGTDLSVFSPSAVSGERVRALREAWHAAGPDAGDVAARGESPRVLLLPGRLTRWKGQTVFLDALWELTQQENEPGPWIAVLAGDAQGRDTYEQELRDQAEKLGLSDRIVFHGHCEDMPAAYLASDLVISPATSPEAFGRVPVEAQAMGRPIIAADHGGSRETVIAPEDDPQGLTGWRVPPGDAGALAVAIAHALSLDWPTWEAIGRRGRAQVEARYSLDAMTGHTLRVYDRVLNAFDGE